jgi:hypothetical protein
MLKRRLTLIFKVDNPLRAIRPAIVGGDEIIRNFNILQRDRRRNRMSLFCRSIFFAATKPPRKKGWNRHNR